jgi:hypothetical protein
MRFQSSVVLVATALSIPQDLPPNQPSLKLRPSAGALAQAEGGSYPIFIESSAAPISPSHTLTVQQAGTICQQMGAGVALFDFDNDGDLDVFLVQDGPLSDTSPAGTTGYPTSRLFRNDLTRGPDGKPRLHFTDVTAKSGLALGTYGMGVAVGDYNNDGYLDLFVTSFGPDHLFRNNGDGTFTDVTTQAGVSDPLWSTSAVFFDYDHDGDLDLFVANYLDFTLAGNKTCTVRPARVTTAGHEPIARCRIDCIATTATAISPTSQIRRAPPAPTAPASALSPTTTTETAGSISTSPTSDAKTSAWINREATDVKAQLWSRYFVDRYLI